MRAVEEEGVHEVLIRPIADFTALQPDDFWRVLDARGLCHPYDADGRRRAFGEIPAAISALLDDPYRSLASALRRAGGFAKKSTPFSEFAWADFLRRCVSSEALEADFEGALGQAVVLARSPSARSAGLDARTTVETGCQPVFDIAKCRPLMGAPQGLLHERR